MNGLPKDYYPFFEQSGIRRMIPAGQMVFMQGDHTSSIYLIVSGRLRMFYIGENGQEITYRIIGEGHLVGESAFMSHLQPSSVSAVTDTVLIVCPIASLYPNIRQYDGLEHVIFGLLAENYTELCNQIRRLTIHDSEKRVASILLDLANNDNESLGIVEHTLPYTQEELAVCLDLHRTTVAKVLSEFAKRGIVKLSYRKIQVVDFKALDNVLNPI